MIGDNAESDETIVIEISGVTNGTEEGAQTTSLSIPNVCAAPGTVINQSTDFRAAVSDWVANGNASEFGDITQWCTGEVTDMSFAFYNHNTVNPDISGWDTSSVTNMRLMFHFAAAFNQDIGDWDVSKVTDMEQMFKSASAFNANIGGWDISKVIKTKEMFSNATNFTADQDISGWQTGSITDPRSDSDVLGRRQLQQANQYQWWQLGYQFFYLHEQHVLQRDGLQPGHQRLGYEQCNQHGLDVPARLELQSRPL